MEIHGAHRLNGIVIVNEEEVEVDQEIDVAGRGNFGDIAFIPCFLLQLLWHAFVFIYQQSSLFVLFPIPGHEIVEEVETVTAEDQHRVIGIETEIVAKIRRRNASVNVKDCQRLKKST